MKKRQAVLLGSQVFLQSLLLKMMMLIKTMEVISKNHPLESGFAACSLVLWNPKKVI